MHTLSPSFLGPLRLGPCPTHFFCRVNEFAWPFLGLGGLCRGRETVPRSPPACASLPPLCSLQRQVQSSEVCSIYHRGLLKPHLSPLSQSTMDTRTHCNIPKKPETEQEIGVRGGSSELGALLPGGRVRPVCQALGHTWVGTGKDDPASAFKGST